MTIAPLDGDVVSILSSPCRLIYSASSGNWWCKSCQSHHYIESYRQLDALVIQRTWLNRLKAKRIERFQAAAATYHDGHIVKSYSEWKRFDLERARKELIG